MKYSISIAETINSIWNNEFSAVRFTHPNDQGTVFEVTVKDSSELYGVLTALRNMGLTLHSIHLEKNIQKNGGYHEKA